MSSELIGYSDRISVAPGEAIAFKVSADAAAYQAAIVRLIHGDANGPGFKEVVVRTEEEHVGRKQIARAGSYGRVEDHPSLAVERGLTLQMWIFATTPADGRVQGLLSKRRGDRGYSLALGPGGDLTFTIGDGQNTDTLSTGRPVRPRQWYFVAACFDSVRRTVTLVQTPLSNFVRDESVATVERVVTAGAPVANGAPLLIAASHIDLADGPCAARGHFNGKIDRPAIFGRALADDEIAALAGGADALSVDGAVAVWDFARDFASSRMSDTGPNGLHGRVVNTPMRAVTGHNWRAEEHDFKHAPRQYGAIQFHDDDLEDAGWETDFTWHVPEDARSGFYAARLRSGDAEDHITFFVRPKPGQTTAKVVMLVPTMTYLAYANEQHKAMPKHQAVYKKRPMVKHPLDHYLDGHPEFGISLYDVHADGTGANYSSRLRPIPSLRPKYRQWQIGAPRHLAADLYLIDWLEAKGIDYDVVTDHDLHFDGTALLAPYRVVLTGTHPEYWTAPMRMAMEAYLEGGGRQMYLGGNGYYWVTAVDPERPHVIEVRKGYAGTRAWNTEPGELYMSSTGEMGGLWRHRGKPPNEIVGIGFKAMGYDGPTPGYKRLDGSFDPRAAFVFAGIGTDEVIGDFGLVLGGAAGDELDCLDYELGTPPHALLLASATGHDEHYVPVVEDHREMSKVVIVDQASRVRADMVYFEGPNGGAVFSTGSISWCGSLSHNDYDNNVSRITENVLRHFLE
jgi:N,N-dimethylformamidase